MVNPQQYYSPPQQGNLAYLPTAYPPPYYPSSPPTPQQDPLEQLAKTVRLLDYIKGREAPSSQPQAQPSQQQQVSQFGTPGAGNVAQFMPQTQADLDRQYQAMGLTQASGISTQTNSQPWQQTWGQAQVNNNLEARLQNQVQKQAAYIASLENAVNALDQEASAWMLAASELPKWISASALKEDQITDLWCCVATLMPFVQLAEVRKQQADDWQAAAEVVWQLYNDPGHLVIKAFESWSQVDLTQFDLNFISELFLHLLAWQERKDAAKRGGQAGYIPQPSAPPPLPPPSFQSSVPFPPIPGGGIADQDPRMVAINLMRSGNPDAARILQRMRMANQY